MNLLLDFIMRLSRIAQTVAGISLTGMMGLTVADVALRSFGRPIVGSYEVVALMGALVVGFSLPFTSWVRGHIYVDFLVQKLSPGPRSGFHLGTRTLGIALFSLISWNLFQMGLDLQKSGEVSPTLQIPFYPIVYGVGICCLLQALVLLGDIAKILRGKYE
jgi:TRAP-type C4-dicarboxylate transport system permease small subunit